jgi:hypothetical protein
MRLTGRFALPISGPRSNPAVYAVFFSDSIRGVFETTGS